MNDQQKQAIAIAAGVGIGAILAYFWDPDRGRRRRALLRDRASSAVRRTEHFLGSTSRLLSDQARGVVHEFRVTLQPGAVSDETVVARVRAVMGHIVGHPGAIDVTSEDGHVTLQGPVLSDEVDELLTEVSAIPGVRGVTSELEVFEEAGNVPALQGEPRRRTGKLATKRMRVLMGALGGGLTYYGLRQRNIMGTAATTLGLGLLSRTHPTLDRVIHSSLAGKLLPGAGRL
ncbi:MAG: hypothetical protein ACK5AZ_04365 [Bryobacteraceae bacterium]